jgi:inner membrane protein
MDSLTHTLTGLAIARAVDDERIGGWGSVAGLAMGFFPDTDFVLGLFNRRFYLEYHRDFTHSLILLPIYALFFGWLFVRISKRPYFWSYYRICLLVLLSHVVLDLLTSYGTMIFSPFYEHRYAWDLVFIVDLIFSGIIVIPLLASFLWKRKARWFCRGSFMVLTAYILFCGLQHGRAINLTGKFAKTLNVEVVEVASLPQPLSPFRWANYVETRQNVYQGFVDFLRRSPRAPKGDPHDIGSSSSLSERLRRLNLLYQPPGAVRYASYARWNGSPWVDKALTTEGVQFYYWFARFPVVKSVQSNNGTHRVEFVDVRFSVPGIRLPFLYYVEFDESGRVRSEGFASDGKGS